MKIIVDTNVFISGVFFSGSPHQILNAWRDCKIQLAIPQEILKEYRRVGKVIAEQFPSTDLKPILDLATLAAVFLKPVSRWSKQKLMLSEYLILSDTL